MKKPSSIIKPEFPFRKINLPFDIIAPPVQTAPIVFVSPHSGAEYSPDFLSSSFLDQKNLSRSEDRFVDDIFSSAPTYGAPILRAKFPRVFLDPNREPWELDPTMFEDELPNCVNKSSHRVRNGFGTIPKITINGEKIYKQKLKFQDAEERIGSLYIPFHDAIQNLLASTVERFGIAILIDCHSMPSVPKYNDSNHEQPDIILGDCYGTTCSNTIIQTADQILTKIGFTVTHNVPYAGGFITKNYGRPNSGTHAFQIEIKRSLYMDEIRLNQLPKIETVRQKIGFFIRDLTSMNHAQLSKL